MQSATEATLQVGQVTDSATLCLLAPSAMSIILGTWMEQSWYDFWEPPDFPSLQLVLAYVQLSMPGLHLQHQTHFLLAQLQDMEASKAEAEGEEC